MREISVYDTITSSLSFSSRIRHLAEFRPLVRARLLRSRTLIVDVLTVLSPVLSAWNGAETVTNGAKIMTKQTKWARILDQTVGYPVRHWFVTMLSLFLDLV